jgi:pimeloyl-ACP methyl ester carboxylesterase
MAENVLQKKKLLTWAWRFVRLIFLLSVSTSMFLYFIQNTLIFPGSSTQGRAEANFIPLKGVELVKLTTKDGNEVTAAFATALDKTAKALPDASSRPTMLYFYGNGMCLRDCMLDLQQFRMLGVNVLIPEYIGYGLSTGKASEEGCYATSEAAYAYLLSRKDVNPKKIVISGWSLGSAVAIDLASKKQPAGLATFSAFTSMTDMAKKTFPFFPWPGLILKYRFDSQKKIANVKCPVFLSHGKVDSLIPWQMTENLASSVEGTKTILYIDKADHADIFSVGGSQLLKALEQFLQTL